MFVPGKYFKPSLFLKSAILCRFWPLCIVLPNVQVFFTVMLCVIILSVILIRGPNVMKLFSPHFTNYLNKLECLSLSGPYSLV